jgi:hypothetical protein
MKACKFWHYQNRRLCEYLQLQDLCGWDCKIFNHMWFIWHGICDQDAGAGVVSCDRRFCGKDCRHCCYTVIAGIVVVIAGTGVLNVGFVVSIAGAGVVTAGFVVGIADLWL